MSVIHSYCLMAMFMFKCYITVCNSLCQLGHVQCIDIEHFYASMLVKYIYMSEYLLQFFYFIDVVICDLL